jgi:hypothetical protein
VTLRPRVFPAVPSPVGGDTAHSLERADITVSGLDHGGLSYEVRVFLGNPGADADTPLDGGAGYAGSIHVYGQGRAARQTVPDEMTGELDGVLAIPAGDATRPRRSIVATEAVRAAAARGAQDGEGRQLSVTLVPVAVGAQEADVDLDAGPISVRID